MKGRDFFHFLREKHLLFASAESCTGGLIASSLTSFAGASEVYWGGAVVYSNSSKTRFLDVPESLLMSHGAVSEEAARAMVSSLCEKSGADLCLSVTGIAGPGGGSPEKPVGTVWFGIGSAKLRMETRAVLQVFPGNRRSIQRQAASFGRQLCWTWWKSGGDLDSLRLVTDNE